jgi:hypothetical protein
MPDGTACPYGHDLGGFARGLSVRTKRAEAGDSPSYPLAYTTAARVDASTESTTAGTARTIGYGEIDVDRTAPYYDDFVASHCWIRVGRGQAGNAEAGRRAMALRLRSVHCPMQHPLQGHHRVHSRRAA